MADMVACNPGIWFSNEPYAVADNRQGYEVKKKLLPLKEHSAYFNLSAEELDKFADYTTNLLGGKLRPLGTCRHTKFGCADRAALKILNAPWMLNWFLENFESSVLIILRHPGAQMASTIRQGWEFQLSAIAKDIDFLHNQWSEQQVLKIIEISKSGDVVVRAMLDWIVNSQPLRLVKHAAATKVSYEELVTNPIPFIHNILLGKCELPKVVKMEKLIKKPSGSMHLSTAEANSLVLGGKSAEMLNKWKDYIDEDNRRRCQDILDLFEIEDYRMI